MISHFCLNAVSDTLIATWQESTFVEMHGRNNDSSFGESYRLGALLG